MSGRIRLCRADAVAEGTSRGFDPGATGCDTLFVVRNLGRARAWRNSCPHWPGTPLAWRKDGYLSGDGRHIMCSAHGALFEPDTGQCTLGPCMGEFLEPIPLFEDQGGDLYVAAEDSLEN